MTNTKFYVKSKPEYYLEDYADNEIYSGIKHHTHEKISYSGIEYKELFMSWYNKIKPSLDNDNESESLKIMLNFEEETLAKFDLYVLIRNHFINNCVINNMTPFDGIKVKIISGIRNWINVECTITNIKDNGECEIHSNHDYFISNVKNLQIDSKSDINNIHNMIVC